MTNIAGIFDSKAEAERTISELVDAGFKSENIRLIAPGDTHHSIFASPIDDKDTRAIKGSILGALIGGALGALAASLSMVKLFIPGVRLPITGHMIAIIAGACVGAAAGSLSGALVSAGFAVDATRRYKKALKQGKTIVIVYGTNARTAKVRIALRNSDATIKTA